MHVCEPKAKIILRDTEEQVMSRPRKYWHILLDSCCSKRMTEVAGQHCTGHICTCGKPPVKNCVLHAHTRLLPSANWLATVVWQYLGTYLKEIWILKLRATTLGGLQ